MFCSNKFIPTFNLLRSIMCPISNGIAEIFCC